MVSARRIILLATALAGACNADFEDPEVVSDIRILGMRAEPPEIITPYDPEDPTNVDIDDLGSVEVCVLVADPTEERGLAFGMTACPPGNAGRCLSGGTRLDLGSGAVDDPEEADAPVDICATIEASGSLLGVIQESATADSLVGFGGVGVNVFVEIRPDGGPEPENPIEGFRQVRYSPELPTGRTPNANPTLDGFTAARAPTGERGLDFELPLGRCGEIEPFLVAPRERITILPRETEGAREEYVLPTFDGGSRRFTENLGYQWHATAGEWSRFESGGEMDAVGNQPPLDSRWTAPEAEDVGDGLDVRMWIIQRDERGGQAWYESCARVVP